MNLKINGKTIKVRVASTPAEKKIGLNNTLKLPENTGVLFDFSGEDTEQVFMTMEKMRYPLDMLFIKDDVVVDVIKAEPGETDFKTKLDFNKVLEVNPDTFLHQYLKGAKVNMENVPVTENKTTPMFKKGGVLDATTYNVKVEDVPIDPKAMQILDKNGAVAANIKPGSRIFSRIHTLQLTEKLRDGDVLGLAEVMLKALDEQDKQPPQYTS